MEKISQRQEFIIRKNFLENRIIELTNKIQYTQMNKHEFEECIEERKECLQEHRQVEDSLKSIPTL